MLTFKQLLTETQESSHPSGLAENLVKPYRKVGIEALAYLQKYIACYQENHADVHKFCASYWACHLTVIPKPATSRIQRIFTKPSNDWCDPVFYDQVTYSEILCLAYETPATTAPPIRTDKILPLHFRVADAASDRGCGRLSYGVFAVHQERIYLAPFIHSSEEIVVEWDGLKHNWTDEDIVPDDPFFKRAFRLFVTENFARDHEHDYGKAQAVKIEAIEALREAWHECEEQTRVRQRETCPSPWSRTCIPCTVSTATVEEVVTGTAPVFAITADYDINVSQATDVADMIKSWNPAFIVTAGDNLYSPTDSFEEAVDPLFGDYITDNLSSNRFWPALSNHDWDDPPNGIEDWYDFFTLPNNERYYDVRRGPVHFFILDTEPEEPDGKTATSIQGEWLRVKLALSNAPWKVVICPEPPYTAAANKRSGDMDTRWPFKAWGADVVISGDSHAYERYTVDGLPFIVNGLGGKSMTTFSGYIDDLILNINTEALYADNFGAIRGTATCDTLHLEFINVLGDVIDDVTMTKDASGAPVVEATVAEIAQPEPGLLDPGGIILTGPGGEDLL